MHGTTDAAATPIGVFDSGVGGLTVLRALEQALPGEDFVYFGDTARLPYGPKSEATVMRYAFEDALFLLRKGAKFLVVACNTASSVALPDLQRYFRIPVVGVIEPGARAAVAVSRGGVIGVIGTAGTIRSKSYQSAIEALAPGTTTRAVACPLFVPLAEEGWQDEQPCRDIAERYLGSLRDCGVDTLVLGCTHYPLLRATIGSVMGPDVVLVDSAAATAAAVVETLQAAGLARRRSVRGATRFFLSDFQDHFRDIAARILERDLVDVELASAGI